MTRRAQRNLVCEGAEEPSSGPAAAQIGLIDENGLSQDAARAIEEATMGLFRRAPHYSARRLLRRREKVMVAGTIGAIAAAAICAPMIGFVVLNIIAASYFAAAISFRLLLTFIALRAGPATRAKPLRDAQLPVVTVLLPVYDEAEGLPILAAAMTALDYPSEKLDIKLLLEKSDRATIAEANRLGLDKLFDCLIVPDCAPKTKPKACNWGLQFARGALTVIYDAEDAPEPDQLRKAAAAFAAAPADLACVQARLNFYNAEECLLSRLFALEYALWFDLLLPALERLRLPVPLGGTSNIFRTDILRLCGGWDPHNVTEDADLGLRLARLGYRTSILDSTTYEEANCRLSNWIRQRSRWMKGYVQTWIVHRRPDCGVPRFGLRRGVVVDLFVGGNVFGAIITPTLALLWLASGLIDSFAVPQFVTALNASVLIGGNLACAGLAAVAPARRGWLHLAPFAVFAPIYGLLASFAAFKAVMQLITRPSYWEKTDHCVSAAARQIRAEICVAAALREQRSVHRISVKQGELSSDG